MILFSFNAQQQLPFWPVSYVDAYGEHVVTRTGLHEVEPFWIKADLGAPANNEPDALDLCNVSFDDADRELALNEYRDERTDDGFYEPFEPEWECEDEEADQYRSITLTESIYGTGASGSIF